MYDHNDERPVCLLRRVLLAEYNDHRITQARALAKPTPLAQVREVINQKRRQVH